MRAMTGCSNQQAQAWPGALLEGKHIIHDLCSGAKWEQVDVRRPFALAFTTETVDVDQFAANVIRRGGKEIRSETEYFADIPKMHLPDEMLRITEHILETKKEHFDPAFLEDRYRTVLVEKLRQKQARMPAGTVASVPSEENVINLLDALKRSLAAEQPARPIAPAAKSTIRRAAAKPTSAKRSGVRSRRTG
jgi:hypothetical protein